MNRIGRTTQHEKVDTELARVLQYPLNVVLPLIYRVSIGSVKSDRGPLQCHLYGPYKPHTYCS